MFVFFASLFKIVAASCTEPLLTNGMLRRIDSISFENEVLRKLKFTLNESGSGRDFSGSLEFLTDPSGCDDCLYVKIRPNQDYYTWSQYNLFITPKYTESLGEIFSILVNSSNAWAPNYWGNCSNYSIIFSYNDIASGIIFKVCKLGLVTDLQVNDYNCYSRISLNSDLMTKPLENIYMSDNIISPKSYVLPSNFNMRILSAFQMLKNSLKPLPCVCEAEIKKMSMAATVEEFRNIFCQKKTKCLPLEQQAFCYFGDVITNFKQMEKACGEKVVEIQCIFEAIVSVDYKEECKPQCFEPLPIAYDPIFV